MTSLNTLWITQFASCQSSRNTPCCVSAQGPPIIVLWSFQPSRVQLVPQLQSQHRDHPIFTHKRLLSALLLYRVVSSLSHLLHLPFKCRILSFFELLFAIRCFTFSPIRFYSSSSAPFFQHRDVMFQSFIVFQCTLFSAQGRNVVAIYQLPSPCEWVSTGARARRVRARDAF